MESVFACVYVCVCLYTCDIQNMFCKSWKLFGTGYEPIKEAQGLETTTDLISLSPVSLEAYCCYFHYYYI